MNAAHFSHPRLLVLVPVALFFTAPVRGDASGLPAALRPLVERLSSADPADRAEAACELGRRHAEAVPAVKALTSLLGDDLRVGPVECGMSPWLRKLLEEKPTEWRQFETSPGREAAKALARIGPPALDPVLGALRDPKPMARANAAFAIGEMEASDVRGKALACLVDALRDDHETVRGASARALGEIEDPKAVAPLLATLRDSVARVRATAAWALGEIEDGAAVTGLAGALKDTDPHVRKQAAWALGEMKE